MEKIRIDLRRASAGLEAEELKHNLDTYTVISALMAQEIASLRNLDTATEITDQMIIDEYWKRVQTNYEIVS